VFFNLFYFFERAKILLITSTRSAKRIQNWRSHFGAGTPHQKETTPGQRKNNPYTPLYAAPVTTPQGRHYSGI
jgi:hypothetical protein